MVLIRSADRIKQAGITRRALYWRFPMLRSKQFQLSKDTLALLLANGKRDLIHIPSDSTLRLLSEKAEKDGTVAVHWEGKILRMFLVDIEERGRFFTEDSEQSATAFG